jgi:ornithine--oxo-acid transaminase
MKTREYIELEELYGAHNYHPLDIVLQEASGVWVTDVEGRKYLVRSETISSLSSTGTLQS